MKRALITAEFAPAAADRLADMGYTVELAGWGQTRRALPEDELAHRLSEVSLLVVEVEAVTAAVLDSAPRLEVIAACRSRPVNVDVAAATERGIAVLATPGRNAESVADFAVGVMIALARNISRAERHLRQEGWLVGGEIPYFHFRGPELAGRTLGLIGCGAVGREFARRVRGFGMRVLIYDPYLTPEQVDDLGRLTTLDEVLEQSDFVSLYVPVTEETRGMLGVAELAQIKPTAYLINTARAAVVDEAALFQALSTGALAGAALDVFWEEPLPADSAWFSLDNVLLTPHLGGASDDVKIHHSAMILEDLQALSAGKRPARLVNPEVLAQ